MTHVVIASRDRVATARCRDWANSPVARTFSSPTRLRARQSVLRILEVPVAVVQLAKRAVLGETDGVELVEARGGLDSKLAERGIEPPHAGMTVLRPWNTAPTCDPTPAKYGLPATHKYGSMTRP